MTSEHMSMDVVYSLISQNAVVFATNESLPKNMLSKYATTRVAPSCNSITPARFNMLMKPKLNEYQILKSISVTPSSLIECVQLRERFVTLISKYRQLVENKTAAKYYPTRVVKLQTVLLSIRKKIKRIKQRGNKNATIVVQKAVNVLLQEDDDDICCVCLDQKIDTTFEPCLHRISCSSFANLISRFCPFCRAEIKTMFQ